MDKTTGTLIREMTLEEKASLCSGLNFWCLKGIPRLGIPSIRMSDGPHGLRKQKKEMEARISMDASHPATCFPTASAMASSWDLGLVEEVGRALAVECLEEGVSILLGPGANIKRSPLCGRNFEYFSEDPFFTGEMAAAFIKGVQSMGIGASLKHFAVNNQEHLRMTIDAVVDERALREIYLAGFEKAVKTSSPWTVMCAYNKLDGIHCSENRRLLTEILREEWHFKGVVVTDWGAANDRVEGLKAGQDLEMPGNCGINDRRLVEAVNDGTLGMDTLDRSAKDLLDMIQKAATAGKEWVGKDASDHHWLARKAAGQSIVLLKNECRILPLKETDPVAVIGEFARKPRYQGHGSSLINPKNLKDALGEWENLGIPFTYSQGYHRKSDRTDPALLAQAVAQAKKARVVVVFAGLPEVYESEGFDRTHLDMPASHNELIAEVAKVNENLIVVLQNGSPVAMPWINDVKAVVECYLGGQAGGQAVVDVIYGKVNPSGKLAETFPVALSDHPVHQWFPGGQRTVEYRESIYVGYRYYDKAGKDVLFPFGHGLSYTTFEYIGMKVTPEDDSSGKEWKVSLTVRNNGGVQGGEVVQVYVRDRVSTLFRPDKELKAFGKVFLEPGEEKHLEFHLDERSFSFYDVELKDWRIEDGDFDILAGSSSRDIRLSATINVESGRFLPDLRKDAGTYDNPGEEGFGSSDEEFAMLLGRMPPPQEHHPHARYHFNSTIGEIKRTLAGGILYHFLVRKVYQSFSDGKKDEVLSKMSRHMIHDMPLRGLVMLSQGRFTEKTARIILFIINLRFLCANALFPGKRAG
ncbi:MAG: glycoside hydrolase family 3 C-terminal domain-containing protein [Clostridia bacterium]